MLHTACWKYRTQKVAIWTPLYNLSGYICITNAHIDNLKKNLLSSSISSTCPNSMVNFGPLAAEIGPVVWSTPANLIGFHVLAALLHSIPVVGVSPNLRL